MSYSIPAKINYDHLKAKHPMREAAEAEVRRMKRSGHYEGSDRLDAYYNSDMKGWFVGRRKEHFY